MTTKTNYIHVFFVSLLAIHYVVPLIFFGQVTVYPHDNLDNGVVFDHIISNIYKGNFESVSYFLAGKIKSYPPIFVPPLFYEKSRKKIVPPYLISAGEVVQI